MPSITIKNLPGQLHRNLKSQAKRNGRYLNGEILTCLDAAVSITRANVPETLESIDQARQSDGILYDPVLVKSALEEGRP
jgi:plasmid stability protein